MEKWWKEAFGYQIYIRSFNDSNNDGIGDINGITEKLDYLSYLGVNLLWICPFYDSPMDDNGYDVKDFYKVSKDYGTIDDFKKLLKEAHKRKIRIIIDLVLNHTSDEHRWFKESRKDKLNKYRNYYIWRPGKEINETLYPPTNWQSFFGGSCWEYDDQTNEYYMRIFSRKMPDLNWENEDLRLEMANMATWWLDLGVDGFRVDAVAHLAKADFIDIQKNEASAIKYSNLPKLHGYLHFLNEKVFSKYDCFTVGEVGGKASVNDALDYTSKKDKELDVVFNFDHNWSNHAWEVEDPNDLEIDLINLKQIFEKWQNGLYNKSWNALYWLNHDHPRLMSHYGNYPNYYKQSGKMLATAMYFMWGTPFIYNGEEIGMTNPNYKSIKDFNDVSTINEYKIKSKLPGFDEYKFIRNVQIRCRDSARTIMQWSSAKYAGFSNKKPWFIVCDNYQTINVEDQIKDDDSILNFYKKIIRLRLNSKYKETIIYGTYKQIYKDDKYIYSYIRTYKKNSILVITNFTKNVVSCKIAEYKILNIILSNYGRNKYDANLLPYEAIVLEVQREDNYER